MSQRVIRCLVLIQSLFLLRLSPVSVSQVFFSLNIDWDSPSFSGDFVWLFNQWRISSDFRSRLMKRLALVAAAPVGASTWVTISGRSACNT